MSPATTLFQYLTDAYFAQRTDISRAWREHLRYVVRGFSRFLERPATLGDLSEASIIGFMRALAPGHSARTVNDNRGALIILWNDAFDEGYLERGPRRVRRLKEPERIPTAWLLPEFRLILEAAKRARTIRTWTPQKWRGLFLTIYDTSHRISPLLRVPRDCLQGEWLTVPAELTKAKRETRHRLHPETAETLHSLPHDDPPPYDELLLYWPVTRRRLWREFERILKGAGLPHDHKGLFHRLRRSSYSAVYAELGLQAASAHASHRSDLSRSYLDPRFLKSPAAIDVLPRP